MIESKTQKKLIACNGAKCPVRFNCGKFFRMNYTEQCFEVMKAPIVAVDKNGKVDCMYYEMI